MTESKLFSEATLHDLASYFPAPADRSSGDDDIDDWFDRAQIPLQDGLNSVICVANLLARPDRALRGEVWVG